LASLRPKKITPYGKGKADMGIALRKAR